MSSLFQTYGRWDIDIKKAKGTYVEDQNGKTYLDFIQGIAVSNLGHCHEAVTEAVKKQLDSVWHVSNLFQNSLQEQAAQKLAAHSAGDLVFFCNSGAEANEGAIKLAYGNDCDEKSGRNQGSHLRKNGARHHNCSGKRSIYERTERNDDYRHHEV